MIQSLLQEKIILFGASDRARECYNSLSLLGANIAAIIDNNPHRVGEKFMDLFIQDVQSVFLAVKQSSSSYVFIICSRSVREITMQIEEQKFEVNNILTFEDYSDIYLRLCKDFHKTIYNIDYDEQYKIWVNDLLSEVDFWYHTAKDNKNFIENLWGYNNVFNLPWMKREVQENEIVMDVGSGPVSKLGSFYSKGGSVQLIPIDPLANYYKAIIDKFSTVENREKMYPVFGMFEFLSYYFGENKADTIFISNALDHCIDPIKGILEALKTLKKDTGELVLMHFINEGEHASYTGLHKWNLGTVDNDFVVWNHRSYINVSELLSGYADVSVRHISGKELNSPRDRVLVNIVKLRDIDPEKILGVKDTDRMVISIKEIFLLQENLNYCQRYIELMNS